MVADFYFELHFDAVEMRMHFGATNTTLGDALRMFHGLRAKGLKIHFWP
jgi:hypothetical protein